MEPQTMVIESYLKKLKTPNSIGRIFSKFNKRYFVLDLNKGEFYYKLNRDSREITKSFAVADLISFSSNPAVRVSSDWKLAFSLEFKTRAFMLHTDSLSMHTSWCLGIVAAFQIARSLNSCNSETLESRNNTIHHVEPLPTPQTLQRKIDQT